MLVLTSARAIRFAATCPHPPGPPKGRLLHYAALLEADPIAYLFVVQVGDSLADLAALRGRPLPTRSSSTATAAGSRPCSSSATTGLATWSSCRTSRT